MGDLPKTTQASLDPLNKRVEEINGLLLADINKEAGIGGEACPAWLRSSPI